MGFLSQEYKRSIAESEKKKNKGKKPSRSPVRAVTDTAGSIARAVGGNTAKFINQAYQEGKQAVDTSKMVTAQATGNTEAFKNASEQSQKDYEGFKKSGGLFNAGTITNEEEAKKGDLKTGARKIGAGTIGVATEVIPFARGATLAKAGGSVTSNLARTGAEGAIYGAAGSGVNQLTEGKFDSAQTIKDSLIGAAMGTAGFGIGKTAGKIFSKEAPTVASPVTKNIPVVDNSSVSTGTISDTLPNVMPKEFTPKTNIPYSDIDFRLRFKTAANDIVKSNPKVASEFLSTGSKDPVNLVTSKLANTTSSKDAQNIVSKLIPDMDNASAKALSKKIASTSDKSEVKGLLYDAATNADTLANGEVSAIPMGKKVSFQDEAKKALTGEVSNANVETPSLTADVVRGKSGNIQNGVYIDGEYKGLPAGPADYAPDLTPTTPNDAKTTVSAAAVDSPATAVTAKKALLGESPQTQVGKGAEKIAEKLDQQLQEFDSALSAPENVMKHLVDNPAVTRKARKHESLNRFEDTLSVLGRYMGKTGTDFGYKLAEGAKNRSNIYEYIKPSVQSIADVTKNLKSQAARKDVGDRLNDALQDRSNLLSYTKNKDEEKLFQSVADVFNYFETEMNKAGLPTLDNYSPRVRMKEALDSPNRMMDEVRTAVGDEKSRFTKHRVAKDIEEDLNTNILDILPEYISSMSKDLSYRDAMAYLRENVKNINPAYLVDKKAYHEGVGYLQTLMEDVLEPTTSKHKLQDKLISNTYSNQLKFNFKVAAQNMGQKFAVKSQVSKQANRLVARGKIDQADLDSLKEGNIFTNNPVTDEISDPTNVGKMRLEKTKALINKLDPFMASERSNVKYSFDRGATQSVIESKAYKDAIANKMSPKDAFKLAIQDPVIREAAVRRGNMVVNDTQFGANTVTKSAFFRENKSFIPFLSDKWYKQYLRYPHGMTQHISTIVRANDARAIDVLKNGNPAETKLVDFLYSAQSMNNGVDDIIKGIKNGEITDVSMEVAKGYKKALEDSIKTMNKEIKNHSQIKAGKTAKNAAKMWAAASAIQFLFDGGMSMTGDEKTKEATKAIGYSAPVNIPTKESRYLTNLAAPSNPIGAHGIRPEKLTNFIPGVGLVVNRGREINKFTKALMGDN